MSRLYGKRMTGNRPAQPRRQASPDNGVGQRGFTLIECMIVLAILGIIVGIASNSLVDILPRHRLKSAAMDVRQDILKARMEAVKRSSFCTMAFNQNLGGTTWDYIIFEDTNGTADLEYQSNETLLVKRNMDEYKSGVRIDTSASGTGGDGVSFGDNGSGDPAMGFNYRGLPRNSAMLSGSGAVFLTNNRGETRRISVNPAGLVVIE